MDRRSRPYTLNHLDLQYPGGYPSFPKMARSASMWRILTAAIRDEWWV
jgi:hypothetical protein